MNIQPSISLQVVPGGYRARVSFAPGAFHARRPVLGPVAPSAQAAVAAALAAASSVIASALLAQR